MPRHAAREREPWKRYLRAAIASLGASATLLSYTPAAYADETVVNIAQDDDSESLRAKIPVSGSFTLEYEFDSLVDKATLEVWPNALKSCDAGPPPRGTRQTYSLRMKIVSESGKSTGSTTVPHLQVAEHFCFRVKKTTSVVLDPVKLADAIKANGKLIATPEEARQLAGDLFAAVAKGFCSPASTGAGRSVCAPVDLQPLEYPLLEAVVEAHADDQQLKSLQADRESVSKKIVEHKEKAQRFVPPDSLKNKVPSAAWVGAGVTLDTIKAAQATVAASAAELGAAAEPMKTWLQEAQVLETKLIKLDEQIREAQTKAKDSASSGLAKQHERAIAFFGGKVRAEQTEPVLKVRGKTSDFNNYLSPELGVAVARPFVDDSSFTVVPYTAVNVYFTPVDREISLSDAVNPFTQRFALTVGLTLSQELKASRAEFSSTVADTFGILGAGWRVLPFARVAGLVIFAKASPSGGLSEQSKLVAAGALAISADVDVVTFIGNSLSKK